MFLIILNKPGKNVNIRVPRFSDIQRHPLKPQFADPWRWDFKRRTVHRSSLFTVAFSLKINGYLLTFSLSVTVYFLGVNRFGKSNNFCVRSNPCEEKFRLLQVAQDKLNQHKLLMSVNKSAHRNS